MLLNSLLVSPAWSLISERVTQKEDDPFAKIKKAALPAVWAQEACLVLCILGNGAPPMALSPACVPWKSTLQT